MMKDSFKNYVIRMYCCYHSVIGTCNFSPVNYKIFEGYPFDSVRFIKSKQLRIRKPVTFNSDIFKPHVLDITPCFISGVSRT